MTMKYPVQIAIISAFILVSCKKEVKMDFTTEPLSTTDSILIFGNNGDTTYVDSMQIRNTTDPTYSYDNNSSAIQNVGNVNSDSVKYISDNLKSTSPVIVTDDYASSENVVEKPQKRSTQNTNSNNKSATVTERNQQPAEMAPTRGSHVVQDIKPIEIPEDIASCKSLLSKQEHLYQTERNPERKEQIRRNIISLTDKIRYEAKWKGDDVTYEEAKKTYEKYK